MTALEKKKLEVELLQVSAAKGKLELRIHELTDEIARLQDHIKIQEDKEVELKAKIAEA